MTTLDERTVLQCITVRPDGAVEVTRSQQVLRGDEVIHQAPAIQVLTPGQEDLDETKLEPIVVDVLAAVWKPQQIALAFSRLVLEYRAGHAQLLQAQEEGQAQLLEAERQAQAQIAAEREKTAQAHADMLAEQLQSQAKLLSAEETHRVDLAAAKARTAQALADLETARERVAAAHQELDAEHQVLAQRAEEITTRRTTLFEQSQAVRAQASQARPTHA